MGLRFRRGVLLIVLVLQLGLLITILSIASTDPQGLTGAPPLHPADVPRMEPLLGAVQTPVENMDWNPDGRTIALGGLNVAEVAILEARTGRVVRNIAIPDEVTALRWSPDGKWLVVGAGDLLETRPSRVYLFQANGIAVASWEAHRRSVTDIAWSPNGTEIVSVANTDFARWEVPSGRLMFRDDNASAIGESVSWSPDGGTLAFDHLGGPAVYEAATGRLLWATAPSGGGARVAWSHAGDRIAGGFTDGRAAVFARNGTKLWDVQALNVDCCGFFGSAVAWNPEDSIVALASSVGIILFDGLDGTTLRVLVFPLEDYSVVPREGHRSDLEVAWSPKGEALAATGDASHPSFRLWGIRRTALSLWLAAFELPLLLGLPLFIGRAFPELLGRSPSGGSPNSDLLTLGFTLLFFAIGTGVLQAAAQHAIARVYTAHVVPSPNWYALNFTSSLMLGLPAILLGLLAYRQTSWPSPSRPALSMVTRLLGLGLLPILWFAAIGWLVNSMLLAGGVPASSIALLLIPATFGGIGLARSSLSLAVIARTSRRRTAAALVVSGAASVLSFFALVFAVLLGLNILQVPPSSEIALHGLFLSFAFGLAPLLAAFVAIGVAALGVVWVNGYWIAPFYSRLTKGDIENLESRLLIREYIAAHPGAHFREMLRSLPLGSGTLHYHLSVLQREGFVASRRDGMYRRYFPTGRLWGAA